MLDKIITISGGVAVSDDMTADQMIKEADDNLYKAKKFGRNQIVPSRE